jgi:predicted Fe-Mo cluster-binding NifX family protein
MKIAGISEDGVTISQHFGRAPFYVVVTLENGKIVAHERRDKINHAHFAAEPHTDDHQDPRGHGFAPAEQDRHFQMAEAIRDCQMLLVGGMGSGAYYSMEQVGIHPIVTEVADIDEAALQAGQGIIVDHKGKLH